MSSEIAAAYDASPYPDYAFWFTHPNQLGVMARLFGLDPAPPEACRVLELGCAVGGNLLPMAAGLPNSRFVGVDLSPVQIAHARANADELGLDNVTFIAGDLRDLSADLEPFDYVVCHGVFSWVDDAVRAAILDLCRARLTPHGVAYLSYNTLPGWHTAILARDLMRMHCEPFDDPTVATEQALAITSWLAARAKESSGDWRAAFLEAELEGAREMPGTTLLHEYLSPHNRAFYFRDFVALAREHGLDYLADAKPWDMWLDNYDADLSATLAPIPGLVRQAQYLDFVTHRRFRQTLLVRADAPVERRIDNAVVEGLHLHGTFAEDPGLVGLETGSPVVVGNPNRRPLEVGGAPARLALHILFGRGRCPIAFPALFDLVVEGLRARGLEPLALSDAAGLAELRARLRKQLVRLFFGELVSLSLTPAPVAEAITDTPRAGALQRWQANRGAAATNLWHEHMPLDAAARAVLQHLDGSYDRTILAALHSDPLDVTLDRLWRAGYLLC